MVYSYNEGSPDITLPSVNKDGLNFTGWSGTGIDGVSKSVTIKTGSTGDRTYTANFVSPIQYTVQLELTALTYNGEFKEKREVVCKYNNQSSYTVTVNEGDSLSLDNAVPINKEEYSFVGWKYVDKNGKEQTFVNKGEKNATVFNGDTFDSTTVKIYVVCTANYSGNY